MPGADDRAAATRSPISLRGALFAFGALLVGINIASALWTVRTDRARVEQDALRNFSNLTALLAEQTARSLESVNLLLDATVSEMRAVGLGDPAVREARLKDRISGIPQVRSLLLLGQDGRVLIDTAGEIPAGLDMSDRAYFRTHRDGGAGGRFVSDPFVGRASGHWEFAVSEPIARGPGGFSGVLVAKMDVAYFDRLYRSLDIGSSAFVELMTAAGKPITRVSGARGAPGSLLLPDPDEMLAALKRDGHFTGWSPGPAEAGSAPVLISAAAISGLPLGVVVGAPERAVLAPWHREAVRTWLRTLLTSAAMLLLIALAARELARGAAADERVRQSEERYALAVAGANDGIWDRDLVAGRTYCSRRALELLGIDPALEGFSTTEEFEARFDIHPEDRPQREAALEAHIAGKTPFYEGEWRVRHPDGAYRWVKSRGLCVRDADGRPTRLAGSVTDIEERKRYEDALRLSEQRYERAMLASEAGFWEWTAVTDHFYASPRLLAMGGFPPGTTFASRSDSLLRAPYHPEDRVKWLEATAALFAGKHDRVEMEMRMIVSGEARWVHLDGLCTRDAAGAVARWTGSAIDITKRKQAEATLRLSEERYARAMEAADEGHWEWNIATDEMFLSERMKEMLGLAPDARFASRAEFFDRQPIHPDDRQRLIDAREALLSGATSRYEVEYRVVPRPDEVRWVRSRGKLFQDERGVPARMSGSMSDVTERKLAEAEQERLQIRLRQAEKMEAIGRLAGGIAHDFNNILGGILGYGEMVDADAGEGTPTKRYAHNILAAANRARDLVDQILAYSRGQKANRAPVQIDRIVRETVELVRGSLNPGITLELALPAAPLVVVGDATRLHQIVMNLCTNAIQAMGGSGTLRVALEPVDMAAARVFAHSTLAPGRYVLLTVADSGSGMDAATLAWICEPFFTAKALGRGTGLGLSLVYGIVTDSGGAIDVRSEQGCGSTFEIYLPWAEARTVVAEAADAA